MTLYEWTQKNKIKSKELASLCGVSDGIARLWICGAVSPRLIHAHIIERITNKKVKMIELLSIQDKTDLSRMSL